MGQAHNLSPAILETLSQKINEPYGGFTAKTTDPGAGTAPPNSYLVGIPEYGQNEMPLPITPEQIGEFATSRAAALAVPTHYLGGYNDTEKQELTGKNPGSLDVTKARPNTDLGMFESMMQARWGWPKVPNKDFRSEDSVGETDETGEFKLTHPTYDPIPGLGGAHALHYD